MKSGPPVGTASVTQAVLMVRHCCAVIGELMVRCGYAGQRVVCGISCRLEAEAEYGSCSRALSALVSFSWGKRKYLLLDPLRNASQSVHTTAG